MRLLLQYILLVIYLAHLLVPTFMVLDYELRKDYIAETYCVNKDTPLLACNGRCFLSRKLNELNQEKEERHQHRLKQVNAVDDYVVFELFGSKKNCFSLQNGWELPENDLINYSKAYSRLLKPPMFII